jgi:protein-tyrosine phosphatase
MIDIHTHILPGVDDGAPDFEISAAMLAMASADGIREIVATPHANLEFGFDSLRCREELHRLRTECPDAPRLYLGCEMHLTPENLQSALNDPPAFTLNRGDCLLVELPDIITPGAIDLSLQMLSEAGLRPIIAHAERNVYIQRHPDYASHLVSQGYFLQVTASSFFGSFGATAQQLASQLMAQKLAHVIASDAHGIEQRRPLLAKAYEHVSDTFDEATARLLFQENPCAAIHSAPISAMKPSRSRLGFFFQSKKKSHGLSLGY